MGLQQFWTFLLFIVRLFRACREVYANFWSTVHGWALDVAAFANSGSDLALWEDTQFDTYEILGALVFTGGLVVALAFGGGVLFGLWISRQPPPSTARQDQGLRRGAQATPLGGPSRIRTPPPPPYLMGSPLPAVRPGQASSPRRDLWSPHGQNQFPVPLVAPVADCDQRPLQRDLFHSPSPR